MSDSRLRQVLDLARWAPSGDNAQPWRFEILADNHAVIHGSDTRADCVYDFQGRASQLALGALIETLHLAASTVGCRVTITSRFGSGQAQSRHDVLLEDDPSVKPDPLASAIKRRSVQRRPLSIRKLTREQIQALERASAPYEVRWLVTPAQRFAMARLLFASARLRLTAPEAYLVHRAIIAWRAQHSDDRVPDQAIGLDPVTLRLMEWVMQSWQRVRFFNRYLAGTYLPRLQLDLIPGVACAAHFALIASTPPSTPEDFVEAGRAVQRFWLTATHLGLQLQPEMTPLIFSWYHDSHTLFSQTESVQRDLLPIRSRLATVMGRDIPSRAVFIGRTGHGKPATSRSHRLSLARLMGAGET